MCLAAPGDAVARTVAPSAVAIWTADWPTPPVAPLMKTVLPLAGPAAWTAL